MSYLDIQKNIYDIGTKYFAYNSIISVSLLVNEETHKSNKMLYLIDPMNFDKSFYIEYANIFGSQFIKIKNLGVQNKNNECSDLSLILSAELIKWLDSNCLAGTKFSIAYLSNDHNHHAILAVKTDDGYADMIENAIKDIVFKYDCFFKKNINCEFGQERKDFIGHKLLDDEYITYSSDLQIITKISDYDADVRSYNIAFNYIKSFNDYIEYYLKKLFLPNKFYKMQQLANKYEVDISK